MKMLFFGSAKIMNSPNKHLPGSVSFLIGMAVNVRSVRRDEGHLVIFFDEMLHNE
jgi:hypothetical protein